jgi:hypothetical protein
MIDPLLTIGYEGCTIGGVISELKAAGDAIRAG